MRPASLGAETGTKGFMEGLVEVVHQRLQFAQCWFAHAWKMAGFARAFNPYQIALFPTAHHPDVIAPLLIQHRSRNYLD